MTMFSVWNYDRQLYDYYQGGTRTGTHAGAPPATPLRHKIGATPEGASWSLPIGAKKIGSGALPKGRIARSGIALGVVDMTLDAPKAAALAVIAYIAWRHLR